MSHSVERPTLDFDSVHNLMVREIEPCVELWADSVEPAWDSLSPSLTAPPLLALFLSVSKINKHEKNYFPSLSHHFSLYIIPIFINV